MVGNLLMSCRFTSYGCSFKLQLRDRLTLSRHERLGVCDFHPKTKVQCGNDNSCGMMILREEVSDHKCIDYLKEEYKKLMKKSYEYQNFEVQNFGTFLITTLTQAIDHFKDGVMICVDKSMKAFKSDFAKYQKEDVCSSAIGIPGFEESQEN